MNAFPKLHQFSIFFDSATYLRLQLFLNKYGFNINENVHHSSFIYNLLESPKSYYLAQPIFHSDNFDSVE